MLLERVFHFLEHSSFTKNIKIINFLLLEKIDAKWLLQ